MTHEELVKHTMERYGISKEEAEISVDRRKVYGEPKTNHKGIAMSWAALLQPWVHRIAALEPLPPHVVALMMCAVKLNRQRIVFHKDNFDDMAVYQAFAKAWQEEDQRDGLLDPNTSASDVPVKLTWQRLSAFEVKKTAHPIGDRDFTVRWSEIPSAAPIPMVIEVGNKVYDVVERQSKT